MRSLTPLTASNTRNSGVAGSRHAVAARRPSRAGGGAAGPSAYRVTPSRTLVGALLVLKYYTPTAPLGEGRRSLAFAAGEAAPAPLHFARPAVVERFLARPGRFSAGRRSRLCLT